MIIGNDGSNTLDGGPGDDLIYGFDPNGPQANVNSIAATRVAAGLNQPLYAVAPPDDLGRLFIVEKGGQIKILDLATQQVLATPFLDLTGQIGTAGERGLLGLAFDPDYAHNGYFYVNVINPDTALVNPGDTEIRRYQVSANPNVANAASATPVITIDQPGFSNHKAGWLDFGPDGYLYAALGDGGSAGDPNNNAQNMASLLGKMLRLDVHADAFPADATRNYAIPAGNPFAGAGVAGADEIFALGLRNPWRDSFDRATGDFYIADVGQDSWEEIDIGQVGANYGWKHWEGPLEFSPGTPVTGGTLTDPIYVYSHAVGHSITGGYVYRGPSEGLQGQYFFADFIDNKIFTLRFDGNAWVATERTAQIAPDVGSVGSPASFAQDGSGNLYVVDFGGEVFRLTPTVISADQGDVLRGMDGNDMLFGGSGADMLDGGTGNDELQGGPGDDQLDGGAGNDALIGGAGNDTYIVDSPGDAISEGSNAGTDTVQSAISYTLGANVENLILTGTADINGTGNALANSITGNSGNNTLDGGAGNDNLNGGLGNDVYVVDSAGDVINDTGGNDAVATTLASYTLAPNLEYLAYTGSGNFTGTGNALKNYIAGGPGNDTLDGGPGNDNLNGGLGNDVYIVDSAGDVINDTGGNDAVATTLASYTLAPNLEYLAYTGSGNFTGTGNALKNYLGGGAGNDTLDGLGGADTMAGGAGNDIYVVDNAGDVVLENPGGGIDTVNASVSYSAPAEVEVLNLTGVFTLNGTGNALANTLNGNSAANTLDGRSGADMLFGGGGNDVFAFQQGEAQGDSVLDFTGNGPAAGDSLRFTGFGPGATLNQVGTTDSWAISYGAGQSETIRLVGVTTLSPTDYQFL